MFDPIAALFVLAVRSPAATSTAHHSSSRDKGLQGMARKHGEANTKNTRTVRVEKGSTTGEAGAAGASGVVGRGGNSPAASSAEKVVVARYGPRPHPKKHN